MRATALALASLLLLVNPALAQQASGDNTPDTGDKLPAQLPSVTVQGEDHSTAGDDHGKVAPMAGVDASPVKLPDPLARRATSEGNAALMVDVTPSTLLPAAPLPQPRMPYTSIAGAYGPVSQYQLDLYDSRFWGPALGITQLGGHAGWGWSDWSGQEALDWTNIGRLDARGDGFAWNQGALKGSQLYWHAGLEHGDSETFLMGVDADRGYLGDGSTLLAGNGLAAHYGARAQYRPAPAGDHQFQLEGQAQYRAWGNQAGPEGYAKVSDFWSLSNQVQFEGALGGGYWGFEPVADPMVAFHYRPRPDTHFFTSLQSETELPNFADLYLRRAAAAPNPNLQAERVDGWGQLGASQRLTDALWGIVGLNLKHSLRHIYWADTTGSGLWTPVNASDVEWLPGAFGRLQIQWAPGISQQLAYGFDSAFPLGAMQHDLSTTLDGTLLDQRLELKVGLDGRMVTLSTSQSPGGGFGEALYAELGGSYALSSDWRLGLQATDVPLLLHQPAADYFMPLPLVSAKLQYEF
ncbi:MAG TPA: hypothetical protein V6D47_07700 [Oscillatoriaceae cyanobacterium]